MKRFILMLQFLTRIPINKEIDIKDGDFAKGVIYFPFVGLVIGTFNAFAYWLFSKFTSGLLPLVIATLVNVLITGALHVDGLADICDGIFSARKKDRMLEIMKDSRIGTNGAIAIFFDLILRIVLLSYVNESHIIKVILVSTIISRTMLVVLMYISRNARSQGGLGSLFIGRVTIKDTILAVIFCSFISFFISGYGVLIILPNIVLIFIYRNYILSKVNIITGDALGAANEISEIFVFLVFIVMERYLLL